MKIKKLNKKYTGTFATRIVIALTIVIGVVLVAIVSNLADKSKDCELPKISPSEVGKIDSQTFFVIGHAYGKITKIADDPTASHFISPEIIPFFDKHFRTQTAKANIILTGDIIATPTKEKLQKLKKVLLSRFDKFFIAPGNHDIFNHNTHDLFFAQFPNSYPYIYNADNLSLVFLDTVTKPWLVNIDDFRATLAKAKSRNVIVFSHNQIYPDLLKAAKTNNLLYLLPDSTSLKKQARAMMKELKNFNAVLISGDARALVAYDTKPSTICRICSGVMCISNGLIGIQGKEDEILLIQKGNIYRMALK